MLSRSLSHGSSREGQPVELDEAVRERDLLVHDPQVEVRRLTVVELAQTLLRLVRPPEHGAGVRKDVVGDVAHLLVVRSRRLAPRRQEVDELARVDPERHDVRAEPQRIAAPVRRVDPRLHLRNGAGDEVDLVDVLAVHVVEVLAVAVGDHVVDEQPVEVRAERRPRRPVGHAPRAQRRVGRIARRPVAGVELLEVRRVDDDRLVELRLVRTRLVVTAERPVDDQRRRPRPGRGGARHVAHGLEGNRDRPRIHLAVAVVVRLLDELGVVGLPADERLHVEVVLERVGVDTQRREVVAERVAVTLREERDGAFACQRCRCRRSRCRRGGPRSSCRR